MNHKSAVSKVGVLIACVSALAACRSLPPSKAEPPVAGVTGTAAVAAEPWYESEIRAFEAADREHPPATGQILFTGSSSIRMWKDAPAAEARIRTPYGIGSMGQFGGSFLASLARRTGRPRSRLVLGASDPDVV